VSADTKEPVWGADGAPVTTSAGSEQASVFTGIAASSSATGPEAHTSVKGIAPRSIPAFVAGEELAHLAANDERVVVLTADLASANRLTDFADVHPERFFDMGIAEKNMVTAAAGMAASGLVPFVGTFASFAALLCFEQIRTDCAYPEQPVRVLAHHAGISLGYYGTSHHAIEDLAAMRAVPGLVIVCAADASQLRWILRTSLDVPSPMYIRLGRGRDPEVYPTVPTLKLGKASVLRDGTDLTIVATGSEVRPALDAAEMLASQGVAAGVVDMHTVKPLDKEAIMTAAGNTAGILTVEEHSIVGGLGGAVAEVLAESRLAVPFRRHGLNDEYSLIGPPAALYAHYRLDAVGIASVATEFLEAC